jgi:hypothetical protein
MLILDATTKSIVVAMSSAAATTNPDFTAAYSDSTGTTFVEGANDGALNGTSSVTLVAAPSASTRRIIKTITIENRDTAAVTLTISYNNNGTLRTVAQVTLAIGDTWTTAGTYDNYGQLKQTVVPNLSSVVGTLGVANGGTGVTTLTGYVKASGTTPMTASSTIPSGDISGLGTMAVQNANAVAVSGGAIDGTTVGASTASTGSFTTLTTSSTITFNGSTASTVPYLDASKVVTTGTNFTFNGTTLKVGTASALGGTTNPLMASTGNANNYIQTYIYNTNAGTSGSADFVAYTDNSADTSGWMDMGYTSSVYADATYSVTGPNEGYLFASAPSGASKTGNMVIATDATGSENSIQFYTGGFNQAKSASSMIINGSGNVGIGVASPSVKLEVKGTLRLNGSSSGYVGLAPAASAGSTTYTLPSADGTSGQVLSTNGSGSLSWTTASGITTGKSIAMAMIFGF